MPAGSCRRDVTVGSLSGAARVAGVPLTLTVAAPPGVYGTGVTVTTTAPGLQLAEIAGGVSIAGSGSGQLAYPGLAQPGLVYPGRTS